MGCKIQHSIFIVKIMGCKIQHSNINDVIKCYINIIYMNSTKTTITITPIKQALELLDETIKSITVYDMNKIVNKINPQESTDILGSLYK